MIGLIRSEFLKLRSVRSNLTMAAAALSLPIGATILLATFSGLQHINPRTLPELITGSGNVSVLICGIIGVLCITQEYSQGTIRLTIAATPNRTKVFIAKLIVVIITGIAISTTFIVVATAIGRPILSARGYHGDFSHPDAIRAFLAMIVMSAIVSSLGLAIGTTTRNPPSAVATLVLWPLLVEAIAGNVLATVFDNQEIPDWMPFRNAIATTFVDFPELRFSRVATLGYFGLWVLTIAVAAGALLHRRDA